MTPSIDVHMSCFLHGKESLLKHRTNSSSYTLSLLSSPLPTCGNIEENMLVEKSTITAHIDTVPVTLEDQ